MGILVSVLVSIWALALAYKDWQRRRLPNSFLGAGLAFGGLHLVATGMSPFGALPTESALAGMLGLLAFMPVYAAGWMGAGDVKFIAVTGWLGGLKVLWTVVLLGSLLAGGLALLLLLPWGRQLLAGGGVDERLQGRIPFGVSLALVIVCLAWGVVDAKHFAPWSAGAYFG